MKKQTLSVKLLAEQDLQTSPVSVQVPTAQVNDAAELTFKVEIPQPDGTILIESVKFTAYETQKIRSVLNKA